MISFSNFRFNFQFDFHRAALPRLAAQAARLPGRCFRATWSSSARVLLPASEVSFSAVWTPIAVPNVAFEGARRIGKRLKRGVFVPLVSVRFAYPFACRCSSMYYMHTRYSLPSVHVRVFRPCFLTDFSFTFRG